MCKWVSKNVFEADMACIYVARMALLNMIHDADSGPSSSAQKWTSPISVYFHGLYYNGLSSFSPILPLRGVIPEDQLCSCLAVGGCRARWPDGRAIGEGYAKDKPVA